MKEKGRNEKLLLGGQWTSKLGDILFDYVNSIVIVTKFQNSSWILALYQSSATIINIIFNLIGGMLADMSERKKILIISDFLCAIVCCVASFFVESDEAAIVLIIANATLALIFSFSSPTYRSIVPEMIDKNRINFYNSIFNAGNEVLYMVGPVFGMVLINIVKARGALLINAATFFISGLSEIFLKSIIKVKEKEEKTKIIKEIKAGMIYLKEHKKLLLLVSTSAFVNFFLAGYNLLLPYTETMYATGFYGKALVASAIGGILGSFINSKVPFNYTKKETYMSLFLSIAGGAIIFFPILSNIGNEIVVLIPFAIFSIALTMFNINFMSYVQTNVEEHFLGRVFSVIFTVAVAFMPVGTFFFSRICDITTDTSFYVIGIGILILSCISTILIKRVNE